MTGDAGAEAALALMVGGGVPAALITDGVGYFGGAVTRWIGIQATHLSAAVATCLSASGLVSNGVALFVVILPAFVIGLRYPLLIGAAAGGAVAWGAQEGTCQSTRLQRPVDVAVLCFATRLTHR